MINDFNKKAEAYLSTRKHSNCVMSINSLHLDPQNLRFADIKYTQNNSRLFKSEVCQKSIFLYRSDFDYTLYAYPLSLLATNRMTNTLISRQPRTSALRDLSLIRQCQPQGLLLGFAPYLLFSFYNSIEVHSFEKRLNKKEYLQRESSKQRILGTLMDFTYI